LLTTNMHLCSMKRSLCIVKYTISSNLYKKIEISFKRMLENSCQLDKKYQGTTMEKKFDFNFNEILDFIYINI